ncbi:MAG TPA: AAA family ATPase [Steroidobacteraceae bacterium]|jgi:type II secretory pathway predicted ATPase ExeA/pSer/pThr/pTyr-binding forkhead associated (FHA) protein|nr:AAA family ATPase [Steroidobacteraceae bacterium]
MYLDLFKLNQLPFRLTPDPAFLYLSRNHARAKAYMESTIWFTDGFVIITGEIGAGKTTLIETFLKELEKDVIVALVKQTQLSPVEFLQAVLVEFGIQPFHMKKVELLATLNNFLVEQYQNGRRVLLVVDEAQNLATRVLEEVRLLSGVETSQEKILRIILVGQPELNQKLDQPDLAQLTQRVRLRFHLTPLSREDSEHYIQHRLEVAGSGGRQIFMPDTFPLIYKYTGGVPRLTNTLCDTAMMSAFTRDSDVVTAQFIQAAINELGWREFAEYSAKLPTINNLSNTSTQQILPVLDAPAESNYGRLLLSRQGESIGTYLLKAGRFIIGRTAENDLQVDSKFVSRHHVQIITTKASSVIEDLNSTNGISYNGKRIRRRVLNDGDVIQLGEHELMYMDDRPTRSPTDNSGGDDAVPMLHEVSQRLDDSISNLKEHADSTEE